MTQKNGLLHGVRVIDLTRVLAGPFGTMMLGDLGADVIKIEVPGKGDDTRQWGPPFAQGGESAYFLSANRNKRSITLNLKSEQGLAVLKDLIRQGDVLVENFKAGTLARLGLDETTLQELRPDLIYCTITGYGYSGPYKDRPGYDFITQALSGLMGITGPIEGEPTRVGVAIADILTGIFAANAIMAALVARGRTGEGARIDLSLLDSQVAALSYVASNYLISGQEPQRYGNGHPNIVPYQSFKARDKFIAFAAGNDYQWGKFCQAVGKEAWVQDERFATNPKRVENREVLIPLLDELFATKDAQDWLDICEQIGLPAAPINKVSEVFEHPQMQARQRVIDVEHPTAGVIQMVASPLNVLNNPPQVRYPPPLLGQHNEEILREVLGYNQEKIEQLKE